MSEGGRRRKMAFLLFSVPLAMLQQPLIVNSSLQLLQYSQHQPFYAPSEISEKVRPRNLGNSGTNHAMFHYLLSQGTLHGLPLPDHVLSSEDQTPVRPHTIFRGPAITELYSSLEF